VVGGWHLAPYPDEIIAKTGEALKQINPFYLIPMHWLPHDDGSPTRDATEAHYALDGLARGRRRLAPIPLLIGGKAFSRSPPAQESNLRRRTSRGRLFIIGLHLELGIVSMASA
jgi:hypothetical protein